MTGEKAGERFSKDAELSAEIRVERESLRCFDNEGGKKRGRGADPKLRSNDGVSALMYASIHGHTDAVRLLLAEGADSNLQNNDGVSALMRAANRGHADIVRALLAEGADPNLQDNGGWTALMCAAIHGHADIVRALLNGGANPNLHSKYGEKALDVAFSRGIKEMLADAERKWRQGGRQQEQTDPLPSAPSA